MVTLDPWPASLRGQFGALFTDVETAVRGISDAVSVVPDVPSHAVFTRVSAASAQAMCCKTDMHGVLPVGPSRQRGCVVEPTARRICARRGECSLLLPSFRVCPRGRRRPLSLSFGRTKPHGFIVYVCDRVPDLPLVCTEGRAAVWRLCTGAACGQLPSDCRCV